MGMPCRMSGTSAGTPKPRADTTRDAPLRLLVLAADVIPEAAVEEHLKPRLRARGAQVHVVAPAITGSPLKHTLGDVDDAIVVAEDRLGKSLRNLEEAGVAASGAVGDADPMVAIEDALATFPADRIVVFSHPDPDYREDAGLGDVEERFGLPVTRATIGR
jgi:hypothetical protein